jgi:hypothetical protein
MKPTNNGFRVFWGTLILAVGLVGCAVREGAPLAEWQKMTLPKSAVRFQRVQTASDSCRIDMAVTNLNERTRIRPRFRLEFYIEGEEDKIRDPSHIVDRILEEIEPWNTLEVELETFPHPCRKILAVVFRKACHWGAFAELTHMGTDLVTASGLRYDKDFDYLESLYGNKLYDIWPGGLVEIFRERHRVECPLHEIRCTGPVSGFTPRRRFLLNLEGLDSPTTQQVEGTATYPRIDLGFWRVAVSDTQCRLELFLVNMDLTSPVTPRLEFEVGFLDETGAFTGDVSSIRIEAPQSSPFGTQTLTAATFDRPCWRVDRVKFIGACDTAAPPCADFVTATGGQFANTEGSEFLEVSLRETPVFQESANDRVESGAVANDASP